MVEADLNDKLEEGLIGLEDVPYPALLGIKVSNCFMKLNACWSIICDITFRPNSVKIHGINYYTRKAITKRCDGIPFTYSTIQDIYVYEDQKLF